MRRILALLLPALLATACGGDAPIEKAPGETSGGGAAALDLRNQSTPFPDVVCSGQPTEEQFDALAKNGVTRMVHLRLAGEDGTGWEEERAKAAGITFERIEIAGADGLTRENVEKFAAALGEGDGKTLVSCGSSNRVGAMFALKAAWLDGKSKDEAMAIGKKAGMTRLADRVEQLLDQ